MEDVFSSHLFQYEKDRTDKQFLLLIHTDRCFQKILGFIRENSAQRMGLSQVDDMNNSPGTPQDSPGLK